MKVAILWYSQTGNSYRCALRAARWFRSRGHAVDVHPVLMASDASLQADLLVFSFPVYNWDVPLPVRSLVRFAGPHAETRRALAIMTYGSAQGNTPWLLRRELSRANILLADALCLRAQDSYIFLKKYWKLFDRRDLPDRRSFAAIDRFLERAAEGGFRKAWIGFNPFNMLHWAGRFMKGERGSRINRLLMGGHEFHQDCCTRCRACERLCPTRAITFSGNVMQYRGELCIGCCGCINGCRTHAVRSGRFGPEYYVGSSYASIMAGEVKRHHRKTPGSFTGNRRAMNGGENGDYR